VEGLMISIVGAGPRLDVREAVSCAGHRCGAALAKPGA
jgi:hypothetical protein